MTDHLICQAILKNDRIEFTGPVNFSTTLKEQIQEDKKFGMMYPRNEKYFTWKAEDWEGNHIKKKQVLYGINLAWTQAELEIPIDVKRARPKEPADFRIAFRRTEDDSDLTKGTLMYHYYPINEVDHPLRGLCVVNTDFPWTVHGNPISMHEINPLHYPEDTKSTGQTFDFDQVYTHEGPGHGLGLPHSPLDYQMMSPSYTIMSEFLTKWDKKRLIAKYGARSWWNKWFYKRWINWYKVRSDRY